MKTLLQCSLVLMMSLNTVAMAQVHPMDTKNENSAWNRMKGTLSNDAIYRAKQNSTNLNSTTSYYWNGVEMELRGKSEYTYENDQLVKDEHFLLEESGWIENYKMEYVYNGGLLSTVTFSDYIQYDGERYIPVHQYEYSYVPVDNEQQVNTEIYREWQEGFGWLLVDKIEYEYENGLISGGSEYTWEITEWVEFERFTITSNNDTTYVTYFEDFSENWVEYSREIYPSITISELFDLYTELSEGLYLEFAYLSLEFPDFIYQEKEGDVWMNIDAQKTNNYYDVWEGKLLLREIQHLYWETEWTVSYNNEIWYNNKVNPDSATVYTFLSGEKEAAGQEIYSYNDASQLTKVDYLQNIGEGLVLQSTTLLNWNVSTSNEPKTGVTTFKLNAAYPNPFNPTTNITYSLEQSSEINIRVYDMLGRYVGTLVTGVQPAGNHRVQFDASGLSSGLYFVRMEAAGFLNTQKITLLK